MYIGIKGLKDRTITLLGATYKGRAAVSASIAAIFVGAVIPLAIFSVVIDELFQIQDTMYIVFPIAAITAVVAILYLFHSKKK
jgi:hypothetical protein